MRTEADPLAFLRSQKICVLFFTATWCGPCKSLKARVETLLETCPKLSDLIVAVDVDSAAEGVSELSVTALPTLVAFEYGKEFSRITGGGADLHAFVNDVLARDESTKAAVLLRHRSEARV